MKITVSVFFFLVGVFLLLHVGPALSTPMGHYMMTRSAKKYCGSKLSNALSVMCMNRKNKRTGENVDEVNFNAVTL